MYFRGKLFEMIITRKYNLLTALTLSVVLCGLMPGVRAQHQPSSDAACAPVPDTRSCIAPRSMCSFTVSPSGEIWLSDDHSLWHSHGMSSCWSRVPHPYDYAVDFSYVVCPDTNTVLIFGRIFNPSDINPSYNKYLRSTDGGKTWDYLSMPYRMKRDKMWVVGRDNGQVWLRVDSILYYSSDKGLHFQEISRIPDCEFRFDMDDNGHDGIGRLNWKDSEGISRESLMMTRDNWAHYEKIPTPFDQHPEIKKNYFFYSFAICQSKMVMEQADRYFWTSIDTIRWQEIPYNIRDFAVDRESEEWVLVTRDNILLRSADMLTFDTVNTHGPCLLTHIKYADKQAVYGYSYNEWQTWGYLKDIDSLYRFDTAGQTVCGLFSEDEPVTPSYNRNPIVYNDRGRWELPSEEGNFTLGSDRDLIRKDNHNNKWYRVLRTSFPIWDVQLCTDDLKGNLLISDGTRQYLVPIDNPTMTLFHYEGPLDDFLKSPVKSVKVAVMFHSCTNGNFDEYVLYKLDGNMFDAKKIAPRNKFTDFPDPFPAKTLQKHLAELNRCYDPEVRAADFNFSQADYDSLRRYVFEDKYADFTVLCNSATKERVLGLLPHLDDNTWNAVIKSGWPGTCTSFGNFEVTMENEAGDKLVVSCVDASCRHGYFPYLTPFRVQCGKYDFPSTSLSFMRFVGEIMPPNMMYRYEFSNFSLLMKAYRYVIWHREAFGI